MKTIQSISILLTVLLAMACSKEESPEPYVLQLPQVIIDTNTTTGTPEVTQAQVYTFFSHDFRFGAEKAENISATKDTVENSLWLTYLVSMTGSIHAVPGNGVNGASYYISSSVFYENDTKLNFSVTRVSGPGELYSNIRMVRIFTTKLKSIGQSGSSISEEESKSLTQFEKAQRLFPEVDFSDYNAVRTAFGL
jgi:hypothetical protein